MRVSLFSFFLVVIILMPLSCRNKESKAMIDSSRDLYSYGDDQWYVNEEYGMALQIPKGYMPSKHSEYFMTNHGSEIFNRDSTIRIYVSAYYDVLDESDRLASEAEFKVKHPDAYSRFVVAQGIYYELTAFCDDKKSEEEFLALTKYFEKFPQGPQGLLPAR